MNNTAERRGEYAPYDVIGVLVVYHITYYVTYASFPRSSC